MDDIFFSLLLGALDNQIGHMVGIFENDNIDGISQCRDLLACVLPCGIKIPANASSDCW